MNKEKKARLKQRSRDENCLDDLEWRSRKVLSDLRILKRLHLSVHDRRAVAKLTKEIREIMSDINDSRVRWDYEEWHRSGISWMVFIALLSWFVWVFIQWFV